MTARRQPAPECDVLSVCEDLRNVATQSTQAYIRNRVAFDVEWQRCLASQLKTAISMTVLNPACDRSLASYNTLALYDASWE